LRLDRIEKVIESVTASQRMLTEGLLEFDGRMEALIKIVDGMIRDRGV
jgi:hypothetical protein